MAVSICAFNSTELTNQELIDDGLNLFVDWELSDMFSDLLLSRDLAMNNEQGELDQIASLVKVDIESFYKMSNYWDKEQELEHLARHTNEADKARRSNFGNTRFGGASRFPVDEKKYKMTPGPEYDPAIKP